MTDAIHFKSNGTNETIEYRHNPCAIDPSRMDCDFYSRFSIIKSNRLDILRIGRTTQIMIFVFGCGIRAVFLSADFLWNGYYYFTSCSYCCFKSFKLYKAGITIFPLLSIRPYFPVIDLTIATSGPSAPKSSILA